MLNINKRQGEIYQIIKERLCINVSDLISMFDVSAATIRKDLTLLERVGLVFRTHGEVHIATQRESITPFETRGCLHADAKRAIAKAAVSEIHDGESIILDSGSTTLEIAKLLTDFQQLTVITNSLPAAMVLSTSKVTVTLVGGLLLGKNLSVQGPESERYLKQVEVDKAFIASTGVRRNIGLVASNALEASVKNCMMKAARKVYAVLDSSKFSISSIELFADFSEIDAIITEKPIADSQQAIRFRELGTQVIVAD